MSGGAALYDGKIRVGNSYGNDTHQPADKK